MDMSGIRVEGSGIWLSPRTPLGTRPIRDDTGRTASTQPFHMGITLRYPFSNNGLSIGRHGRYIAVRARGPAWQGAIRFMYIAVQQLSENRGCCKILQETF